MLPLYVINIVLINFSILSTIKHTMH